MEKLCKHLKTSSLIVLLFDGLSLLNIVNELAFGELNYAQIPEGAPENILMTTKIFILVLSLVLLLPQIYVGIQGLRIAKKPNTSKKHIILAVILFVLSATGLIEPLVGIVQQGSMSGYVTTVFSVLLELTVFYDYIKSAKEVSTACAQGAE